MSVQGSTQNTVLSKLRPVNVPLCLVLNDRFLYSAQVPFDEFSRVTIKDSFAEVSASNACGINRRWFPLGCLVESDGTYGSGLGRGAPTNFYASVQGVNSVYRKRYANLGDTGRVTGVFPILTLVISVRGGVVENLYWDDDCYFNQDGATGAVIGSMHCKANAYDLDSNIGNASYVNLLNPTRTSTTTGYDTMITPPEACLKNIWQPDIKVEPSNEPLPVGFCDLGVYVTWTGTSAEGQRLESAGKRFRRPRTYAMAAQYPTMLNFQGHNNS